MSRLCLLILVPRADNYQVNNNFAMNAQPLDQFVISLREGQRSGFSPEKHKRSSGVMSNNLFLCILF